MSINTLEVLLLEDDEVLAQVLCKAMQKRGHRMIWVNTAEDFTRQLEAGPGELSRFNLILMDLKLETESSLSHIAIARAACPEAKIFMVTGYASIATTVEAMKQGADDYLPKPISVDDILRKYSGTETTVEVSEDILSPKRLEWEHIQRVLHDNGGNISKTAEILNMHRRTLQRKLQKKPQL